MAKMHRIAIDIILEIQVFVWSFKTPHKHLYLQYNIFYNSTHCPQANDFSLITCLSSLCDLHYTFRYSISSTISAYDPKMNLDTDHHIGARSEDVSRLQRLDAEPTATAKEWLTNTPVIVLFPENRTKILTVEKTNNVAAAFHVS
jgi:hypothetical protein